MNTNTANESYDGRSTLGRLAAHLEFQRTLPYNERTLIASWIDKDVDELKISVMGHAFDGLDFFAGQGKYKQ